MSVIAKKMARKYTNIHLLLVSYLKSTFSICHQPFRESWQPSALEKLLQGIQIFVKHLTVPVIKNQPIAGVVPV